VSPPFYARVDTSLWLHTPPCMGLRPSPACLPESYWHSPLDRKSKSHRMSVRGIVPAKPLTIPTPHPSFPFRWCFCPSPSRRTFSDATCGQELSAHAAPWLSLCELAGARSRHIPIPCRPAWSVWVPLNQQRRRYFSIVVFLRDDATAGTDVAGAGEATPASRHVKAPPWRVPWPLSSRELPCLGPQRPWRPRRTVEQEDR